MQLLPIDKDVTDKVGGDPGEEGTVEAGIDEVGIGRETGKETGRETTLGGMALYNS